MSDQNPSDQNPSEQGPVLLNNPTPPHVRLLLNLGEEELLKRPYNIENQAHRRAVLAELDRIKLLGVKPPQNLWEYKVKPPVPEEDEIKPHFDSFLSRLSLSGGQRWEVLVLALRSEALPPPHPLLPVCVRLH